MANPCLDCGACCAFYRVSFYWAEAELFLGGTVPAELTTQLNPHLAAMRGTEAKPTRCVALQGRIGEAVACGIYEHRPSPCRELMPAWLDGEASPKCDKARAAHGLPPLEPPDCLGPVSNPPVPVPA